jgi:hypothetical protein
MDPHAERVAVAAADLVAARPRLDVDVQHRLARTRVEEGGGVTRRRQ